MRAPIDRTLALRVALALTACAGGAGCAANHPPSAAYVDYGHSPAPGVDPRAHGAPLPAPALAISGNPEARADQLVGSIAASVGAISQLTDRAAAARDVVAFQCENDKLRQALSIEANARAKRSEVRDGALADDDASTPYLELTNLEATARTLRNEAAQCIGEELGYYGGDQLAAGSYDGRTQALERRVDDLKQRTFQTKARFALLNETVLAGPAPARGAVFAAPTTPPPTTNVPNPVPAQPPPPPPTGGGGAVTKPPTSTGEEAHDASMLIRTAELVLAVYEVDKNLDGVEKKAISLGGYLALRSDRQITVRVPREKFDELVAAISTLGDVLHKNVAAEDVTDQYVDLSMRLKNATAVRERLEKLLQTAQVKDAVEIHKELAKVTEEIERLEGKLKLLHDRIAYSTITVSFEKTQQQAVRSQALLPFPWMNTMGLGPLLRVNR